MAAREHLTWLVVRELLLECQVVGLAAASPGSSLLSGGGIFSECPAVPVCVGEAAYQGKVFLLTHIVHFPIYQIVL